jgi:hypothetical protein
MLRAELDLRDNVAAEGNGNSACLPVAQLRSTPDDLAMYHRAIELRSAVTFVAMVLCHYQLLPLWGLLLANVVLYPEIYLRIHDIGHGSTPARYGLAARFVPVSNPIWGGTRVFALVHREHHKHLGTDHDPWLPYYTGHPLRALFFNAIEPEYSFVQYIRLYGVDRELVFNVAYNVACLVAGLVFFPGTYLVHLLSQRTVHAVGIFFFNFWAHRETVSARASIGAWEREHELRGALPLMRVVWGRDAVDGLIYHNRHHCLGQQHVPVQNYKHLADTGRYTQFHDAWPIRTISLMAKASSSER